MNIAKGFTSIDSLASSLSDFDDIYCDDGQYASIIAGRGSSVVADVSSSESFEFLDVYDDGADWTVKLPEGDNKVYLSLESTNGKFKIQGNINCTGIFDCFFLAGSRNGCEEDCFTELIVDGSISGNISVASYFPDPPPGEDYTGDPPTVIVKTTDQEGCEHIIGFEGNADELIPVSCMDGAGAAAAVELDPFPCTIVAGEGGPMDVLECQGETFEERHICHCIVPGGATCPAVPTPAPSSSSNVAMLARVYSVGISLVAVPIFFL